MADWNGANLKLISQGITGGRLWHYEDTGPVADLVDVSGRGSDGYDRGLRVGDLVMYYDSSRKYSYSTNVQVAQDTGDTQVTFGTATLLSDTS